MHYRDAATILQRLIDASPTGSRERYLYQVEQLGQDMATLGYGPEYRTDMFFDHSLQRRYEQGYRDARARKQCGEITLSPLEVVLLCEGGA